MSSAGDFNADGYDDILLGAENADNANGVSTGVGYVVLGRDTNTLDTDTNGAVISLADLSVGNGVLRFDGVNDDDDIGESLSNAGDFNNDGGMDIALCGDNIRNINGDEDGGCYILYGAVPDPTPSPSPTPTSSVPIDAICSFIRLYYFWFSNENGQLAYIPNQGIPQRVLQGDLEEYLVEMHVDIPASGGEVSQDGVVRALEPFKENCLMQNNNAGSIPLGFNPFLGGFGGNPNAFGGRPSTFGGNPNSFFGANAKVPRDSAAVDHSHNSNSDISEEAAPAPALAMTA